LKCDTRWKIEEFLVWINYKKFTFFLHLNVFDMLWCSHFCRKGQNSINPCKIHLLKLPITLKCKNVNQVVTEKKVNSPKYTIVLINLFNNHDLLWPTWKLNEVQKNVILEIELQKNMMPLFFLCGPTHICSYVWDNVL
jgi:hypothetical protein